MLLIDVADRQRQRFATGIQHRREAIGAGA
jgi:hypothetical protein